MTTNSLSEQVINRKPQLNNRAENQTVKKPKSQRFLRCTYDTNYEMVNYMRCIYYPIWQENCPMFVFS